MSAPLAFTLLFDSEALRPADVENALLAFEKEAADLDGVTRAPGGPAGKDLDPLLFTALALSVAPTAAAKFFEFLHAWALRRENRQVKVRIQTGKDKFIEFEASETLPREKIEAWIEAVRKGMK